MEKRLNKIKTNKMIGGVAAGLAEYFDIDVTLVRVAFVVAFFAPIPAIIPYVLLWILLPTKEKYLTTINYTPIN